MYFKILAENGVKKRNKVKKIGVNNIKIKNYERIKL